MDMAWILTVSSCCTLLASLPNAYAKQLGLTEIFLMGGIPVIKNSSIASCYDDSDGQVNEAAPRGSLPVVVISRCACCSCLTSFTTYLF